MTGAHNGPTRVCIQLDGEEKASSSEDPGEQQFEGAGAYTIPFRTSLTSSH